jgi:hypothetical protein
MNELSRSLISAAREGLAPDARTMARVRARVGAAVGAGAIGATAAAVATAAKPAAAATAASAGVASAGLAIKVTAILVTVGVVTAGVATGVVHERRANRALQPPTIAVRPSVDQEVHRADALAIAVARTEPPPTVEQPRRPVTKSPTVAPVTVTPAPEPTLPPLSRESELVGRADRALRNGELHDALVLIATFDRETRGHGQMAEDAAAISIEAHCRLHDDVTESLNAFDHKWPSSAQREKLQTACFSK